MIEAKPENLIGDKAYDSDQLDEQLRREGVEMIAPHKSMRKQRRAALKHGDAFSRQGPLTNTHLLTDAPVPASPAGIVRKAGST